MKALEVLRWRGDVWAIIAGLALAGTALLVRIPGDDGRPLWVDEVWRATLILDPTFFQNYFFAPTVETAVTSPLYALLVKIVSLSWVSPTSLRLSSLLPAVVATLLAFALVRKVGGSVALALLAGLLFVLNRNFIGYANELKPFMFEVFVHLACLYAWLTLIMAPHPTGRLWAGYFSIMGLSILSTPTAIFLVAASAVTLFARCSAEAGDIRRKDITFCVVGFAAIGLFSGALYLIAWRHAGSGDMLTIWADGFKSPGDNYAAFLSRKFLGLWRATVDTGVALPGQGRLAIALLGVVLLWALITKLAFRPPLKNILFFYLIFFFSLCLVNVFQIWPLGALRINLFLYAHLAMLLFLMLAQMPFSRGLARIFLLFVVLSLAWHARTSAGREDFNDFAVHLREMGAPIERSDLVWEAFSVHGPVGKHIAANCAAHKSMILSDGYMAAATNYYRAYDSAHSRKGSSLHGPCAQFLSYTDLFSNSVATEAIISATMKANPDAWFIYTHQDRKNVIRLRLAAERLGHVEEEKMYTGGAGYFHLVRTSVPE